jgi:hypothetical protein
LDGLKWLRETLEAAEVIDIFNDQNFKKTKSYEISLTEDTQIMLQVA